MEFELNDAKLRIYEDGKIERFGKRSCNSKEETWHELKGCIAIEKSGYQSHRTKINGKSYITSRIIYYAFNQDWDIHDVSKNNTIDHIDRNSLNNHISNLRVANRSEQALNRDCVINAKGYCWDRGKWRARIMINKKRIYLGRFDTEQEVSLAFQNAVLKYRTI